MDALITFLTKNGLIFAFAATAAIIFISGFISRNFLNGKIPGSALAIFIGLILAYWGGSLTGGEKGIADIAVFSGFGLLGGNMFRDFAVVATAVGANFDEIKKAGVFGIISLLIGITGSFLFGSIIALFFGYRDAESITTIAAGACTFIVGPITGSAIGASSAVIAISIATGVVKSIFVTIVTPLLAKQIGLTSPQAAMIYGGLMGTTSGVAAGLGATNAALVPYGAITATFYTGIGCLLCPSLLYMLMRIWF
jgi:malonate transporter MadM subunit